MAWKYVITVLLWISVTAGAARVAHWYGYLAGVREMSLSCVDDIKIVRDKLEKSCEVKYGGVR